MNELRTDEEQAEALKKWWSENGTSLVLSIVVVAGGWFGWNTYQDQQKATGEAASAVYSQLVEKVALPQDEKTDAVKAEMQTLASQLKTEFDGTTYSQFAGLFLARFAADAGDFATAEQELRSVIQTTEEEPIKLTAQVRLAKALVEQDKLDDALIEIPAQPNEAYAAEFNEIKGDALFRKGELAQARSAYLAAQEAGQKLGINTQALKRKIDSLTPETLTLNDSAQEAAAPEASASETATPDSAAPESPEATEES